MPNHAYIYEQQAEQYHELIAKQPLLGEELENIRPFSGLDIVDLGAGSGRLSCELAKSAKSFIALDASEAMLRLAASRLHRLGLDNWRTQPADHRQLPLPDNSADLIVSGWSICYLVSSDIPEWRENLRQVMAEIQRVLRPSGTIIILETMGTGHTSPQPPSFLEPYYASLVEDYGFSHRCRRLDYQFDDIASAERLVRLFFGNELADRVAGEQLTVLPECAGIWWR